MKIKNFAIGALAAAMLFTGTSVMEAADLSVLWPSARPSTIRITAS